MPLDNTNWKTVERVQIEPAENGYIVTLINKKMLSEAEMALPEMARVAMQAHHPDVEQFVFLDLRGALNFVLIHTGWIDAKLQPEVPQT